MTSLLKSTPEKADILLYDGWPKISINLACVVFLYSGTSFTQNHIYHTLHNKCRVTIIYAITCQELRPTWY
jgi:hypothetical protein